MIDLNPPRTVRFAALACWICGAFTPMVGVPGTWAALPLALALALPPRTSGAQEPILWTVAGLAFALAFVSMFRAMVPLDGVLERSVRHRASNEVHDDATGAAVNSRCPLCRTTSEKLRPRPVARDSVSA